MAVFSEPIQNKKTDQGGEGPWWEQWHLWKAFVWHRAGSLHLKFRKNSRGHIVFRSSLNQLALKALDDKLLRYHVRPKLHQLGHLAFHFVPKNPRYMSCYQDEDYISRTKALAERCHPVFVSQQACFRYSVRMCLTWSNMCEWKERGRVNNSETRNEEGSTGW